MAADPLSLLREYNIEKKTIIEEDGQIVFGAFSWPKYEPTNFLRFRTGKNGRPKEYYTLETLLFFLKNSSFPHPKYILRAVDEHIPFVHRPDRRDILAYLNGEIASCRGIDRSAPLEIYQNQLVENSCTDDLRAEIPTKKPRFELPTRGTPSPKAELTLFEFKTEELKTEELKTEELKTEELKTERP